MADARRIVIEYIGQDRSAGSTAAKVESKFGKLGGKLDKVGQVAGKALAGGLLLAGAAAVKMGKAAGEDEAAASKLAQTLKTGAGATSEQIAATEAWITAQGKALGVSDDELRPSIAQLAVATGDVGKAQKLAAIAMDAAAGSTLNQASVTKILAKAQTGSLGGFAKLGIATKDAQGKTKTLAQLTDELANKYKGSAAKAAETNAGKQKILAVQLSELGESLGAKLLPMMTKATDIGLKMVDWVGQNTTVVGVMVGVVGALAAVLYTVSLAMRIYVAYTKIQIAITKIQAAATWAWNAALAANPIGLIVIAIAALIIGLVIAYKKSETFRKIVNGAFGAVWHTAQRVFGWVKSNWPKILIILTGPFGLAVVLIVRHWDKIKAGASNALNWIKSHWRTILAILTGPVGIAVGLIARNWNKITASAGRVVDWIRGTWSNVQELLTAPIRAAVGIMVGAFNSVKYAIQAVIDAIGRIHIPKISLPNLPSVPGFARGTSYAPGGVALVGERGPELVTLPRGSRVTPNSQLSAGSTSGGVTIVINGALDPNAVAKQVQTYLLRYKRMTGVNLGLT